MDNPAFISDHLKVKEMLPAEGKENNCNPPLTHPSRIDEGISGRTFPSNGSTTKAKLQSVRLGKKIGLGSSVSFIVGSMIGSGIFVSPTGVMERSGSVAASLLIWMACGILSTLGALSFAELGTLIPKSGGEYIYLIEGFHPDRKIRKSCWRPIPAFLFSWINVLIMDPAPMAIICLICAQYLSRVFAAGCTDMVNYTPPELPVRLLGCCILLLVTVINYYSVKVTTKVHIIFTCAKMISITLIIIGGLVRLCQGYTEELSKGFQGTTSNFSSIATAFYSGLWAYGGWNNITYVTSEMKNPYRDLPLAIMISVPLVMVCYLLVIVSYLTSMTTFQMMTSPTVAVTFGNTLAGRTGEVIMMMTVVLSTFGTVTGSSFFGGRLSYASAKEGHMIDLLSFVHLKNLTPAAGVVFTAVLAVPMVLLSNVATLIDCLAFTSWIFYALCVSMVIHFKITRKHAYRPLNVPMFVPVLVLLVAMYLVLAPLIGNPKIHYFYGLLVLLAGLLVYFPFVYFEKRLPGLNFLTATMQKLLLVVPED